MTSWAGAIFNFNPRCDEVILKGVRKSVEFEYVWGSINSQTRGFGDEYKIKELHLFTHSGPSGIHLQGESYGHQKIKKLPQLNWNDNGRIICHGCYSAVWDGNGNSVAGSFAFGQGVAAEGQSGFSAFSGQAGFRAYYTTVDDASRDVYLWSYGRGGMGVDGFGVARDPVVFGAR